MIQYYYGGSRVVLMAITVHLLDRGKRLMLEQRTPIEASMPPIISEVMQIGSKVQPFSIESVEKAPRIRDAKAVHSVCPY